jgi:hypothetical protein
MRMFSITRENIGDVSKDSLISPSGLTKQKIISHFTKYYRQYILMMILVIIYVIFLVKNLDSDSNQYCKDVTRDFFENCFQVVYETKPIGNETITYPYGYEITTSGQCGTYYCQARSCDQVISFNGTYTEIVHNHDDYYQYDTVEIVNVKDIMVAFYCFYVLVTSVLNHTTNSVIAVKSKIRPFYMTLSILVLTIISATAGTFGKIYLRGESVTNCF